MAKKKKVEETDDIKELSVLEEEEEEKKVKKVVKPSDDDEDEEFEELTMEERIVNIEKKSNIILVLVSFILVFVLITMVVVVNNGSTKEANSGTESGEKQQGTSSNTYDTSKFKEITAKEIASESNGQTIVIMIGRQGCGYCAIYAPILQEVAEKHNIVVRYIDFTKFADVSQRLITDEEAWNTISNLDAVKDFEGAGAKALEGTPATLIVKNNKIVYYIKGAANASTIEEAFAAVGIK